MWLESPPGQIRSDEKGDSIRGAGKEESKCIWARHGVWAYDKKSSRPIVLKEGYFSRRADGEKVEFYRDYYWPFVGRWMEIVGIRGMVHVEGVPNEVSCRKLGVFRITDRDCLGCSIARNGRRVLGRTGD